MSLVVDVGVAVVLLTVTYPRPSQNPVVRSEAL